MISVCSCSCSLALSRWCCRVKAAWRLQVAEAGLDLEVQALLDEQLMDHSVRYWEGAVAVSGSHRGSGYLELSGYD